MRWAWIGLALLLGCTGTGQSRRAPRVEPGATGSELLAARIDEDVDEPLWLEGRVTVIDFWATWCGPCVRAMPRWAEIHQRLAAGGAEVVAVSVDEDRSKALAFVERNELPFRVLWDPNGSRMEKALPWQGVIPFTVIVDCRGKFRHVSHGYNGPEDLDPIADQVEAWMKEESCTR